MKVEFEYSDYWFRSVTGSTRRSKFVVEILEVPSVPVAFTQKREFRLLPTISRNYGSGYEIDYYWHHRKLYAQCRLGRFSDDTTEENNRPAVLADMQFCDESLSRNSSRRFKQALLNAWASHFILIKGKLCERVSEPRYVVMQRPVALTVLNFTPEGHDFYRIDEEEIAREQAINLCRVAEDEHAEEFHSQGYYDRFEIWIPEAVQCKRSVLTDGQ